MLYQSDCLFFFVWTILCRVAFFAANKASARFFSTLFFRRERSFSEESLWFLPFPRFWFRKGSWMPDLLEMPFPWMTAVTIFFIFVFDLQVWFLTGASERLFVFDQFFEELFLLTKFFQASFSYLKDFSQGDVVKVKVVHCKLSLDFWLQFRRSLA